MYGGWHAWMPGGVSGLGGFGDAGSEGIEDCSCNLARSSSGRGRRIIHGVNINIYVCIFDMAAYGNPHIRQLVIWLQLPPLHMKTRIWMHNTMQKGIGRMCRRILGEIRPA